MSKKFKVDNDFSDQCISSLCLKEKIQESNIFGIDYLFKDESGTKLDKDHNIDGYINGTPVQMHMQRYENVKGSINNYCAFTKICRHHTGSKTEFGKIKYNKKNNKPYPYYIIWGIFDEKISICHKIQIINVDDMLKNYKKNRKAYKEEHGVIDEAFFKNSKYYKTYTNLEDGTEALYLIWDKPVYEDQFSSNVCYISDDD